MKKVILIVSVLIISFSVKGIHAADSDVIRPEVLQQYIDQARKNGASEREIEQIKEMPKVLQQQIDQARKNGVSERKIEEYKEMFNAKPEDNKVLTNKDIKDLDIELTSKWNSMRKAVEQGDINTAVSFFCKKSQDNYRQFFSGLKKEMLSQISKDLRDIKFIQMRSNKQAEYDLRQVREGKTFSYMLLFEKENGTWGIKSF